MKKKITTLFTAGLTLLGCLSGTAHVFAASEAAELYTRMQQNNGFYTPIIPAEGIYVDYYDFDKYGGIVVRCKDNAEALPTVAEFMQQRLSSRFVEEPVPFRSDLPAESIHLILNSGQTEEKIAEILSDDRYEVLGTLRTHYQKKAYLAGNWDHSLMIVPAEGCSLDAAMLNTDELLYINTLKCRIKALRDRVKALEDGSVYQKMTSDCIALEHEKDREIRRLKKELAGERARLVTSRNGWIETLDDTEAEYERKLTGNRQQWLI